MIKVTALITLLTVNTIAVAGPQYIDRSGYAAGGYDVVAYRSLQQANIGSKQPEAVPGSSNITAQFNGESWAFSTQENRTLFLSDPEKYAPAYDGHCAYGLAKGAKVPGNPNLWRIVDDRLYLNITPEVTGLWEKDIIGHIESAEQKWLKAEKKRASKKSWRKIKDNNDTYTLTAPTS